MSKKPKKESKIVAQLAEAPAKPRRRPNRPKLAPDSGVELEKADSNGIGRSEYVNEEFAKHIRSCLTIVVGRSTSLLPPYDPVGEE